MVFSSVPLYLDHPNWHQLQQPNNQQGSGSENPQLPQPPPPPLQVGGGGGGSVRPGSMVDRARLAKLPQPEAGLKCPRCESTNTKFCYFNNYNLSQPRHFCKTCRRYWTRGGALRNVPVGGGCRRNKRSSKSSSSGSKSQATTTIIDNQTGPKSTSPSPSSHFHQPPPPFMAALQNITQYGGGFMAATGGGGISDMGFQIGSNSGGNSNILSNFLAGFDPDSNLYTYQSEGFEAPCSGTGQLAAQGNVEETRGLNLSSQLTGIPENNQYWGGNNTWAENNSMSLSFHHCHGKLP